ncbi:MAG: hypothetical protein WKF68_08720 [Daejeonella sp.]
MSKKHILLFCLFFSRFLAAQTPVDLTNFDKKSGVQATLANDVLQITWPVKKTEAGRMIFNLKRDEPLFQSIQISSENSFTEIASNLNPEFLLTVGKRDLTKGSGWNIFFDITGYLANETYNIKLDKKNVKVSSDGSRTKITFSAMNAGDFTGHLEITLYNGSSLFNVAAVMTSPRDSTAIVYDAGMVSTEPAWKEVFWADPMDILQSKKVIPKEQSKNLAVKYRTIIGESTGGSLAILPSPHQFFYPQDNAYNLKYTWYGNNYRNMISGYGIGIRQELMGDLRFVPWFNAPPDQHKVFFVCLAPIKMGRSLKRQKRSPITTLINRFQVTKLWPVIFIQNMLMTYLPTSLYQRSRDMLPLSKIWV